MRLFRRRPLIFLKEKDPDSQRKEKIKIAYYLLPHLLFIRLYPHSRGPSPGNVAQGISGSLLEESTEAFSKFATFNIMTFVMTFT
jgi:hypothetical protein